MELTQLRYFLEVAKNEHITKSAQILHVAQPALTQSIHNLERELGVPLFVQKGRNIRLTPYGRFFYEKLSPVIFSLDELPSELRAMANVEDSTVHLNVLAASSLVTDAIIEYKKIDETLHVQLKQSERAEMYDICVSTCRPEDCRKKTDDYDDVYICSERIFLAVPCNSRFRDMDCVSLRDLRDEEFIALSGSRSLRSICDSYCAQSGIVPNVIFESDSPAVVQNMIGANMGIGFWPDFSWQKLNTSKVKLLNILEPECVRNIVVTYRENKHDATKVRAFYDYLVSYFRMAVAHQLD